MTLPTTCPSTTIGRVRLLPTADAAVPCAKSCHALRAGDHGLIVHGLLQATVERKSLADLVSSLTVGKLKLELIELSAIPRAAVVVEERYSQVFKLHHVRPGVVAMRSPNARSGFRPSRLSSATPASSREWTYRFLAAAARAGGETSGCGQL